VPSEIMSFLSISSFLCRHHPGTGSVFLLLRPWTANYASGGQAYKEEDAKGTVDQEEVKKFERLSWWDPRGSMKELHSMNKLRVPFIKDGLLSARRESKQESSKPLTGLSILDVGCGGGILTEPLGRLGANVIGLDPGVENIAVARLHLEEFSSGGVEDRVEYVSMSLEEFIQSRPADILQFDGIVASETIEHVDNPATFVQMMSSLVKPGGSLFLTTLNRTFESWVGAIVAWEYVLRKLPPGTHQWHKFITPEEVQTMIRDVGLRTKLIHGMCYNPVLNKWSWTKDTSINYCIHAVKD